MAIKRCGWAGDDPLMCAYHDEEWGVPQHDSRMLWEMLMLEGFQAGLAWNIILRKREGFRKAFARFNPKKVAGFNEADINRLMADEGKVRARERRSRRRSAAHRSTVRWSSTANASTTSAGRSPTARS